MNSKFWKDKRVLITGHTGFKGSWLSLWLQQMGANAVGYALLPPTEPSLFDIAKVSDGMISITGDIRDLDRFKKTIKKYKPEIVIHMAAQALVRESYNNPIDTYSTNVMGTVNVLEAVRCSDFVNVLVIITSDKCYENCEWVWGYRETDSMGGHDPYSSSKACAELITSAYYRSYFEQAENPGRYPVVATTRAGNVVGGGDWASNRLVPDIMKAFMNEKPVVIRYPNAIRPWQHALDPIRGYLMLAEKLWEHGHKFAGAWNFGPRDEDAKPVSWVADFLSQKWGDSAHWELDPNYNLHEATFLKLDCSKARSFLGWKPKIRLNTTLEWVVEWYKAYLETQDIRQFTITQIAHYEKYFISAGE